MKRIFVFSFFILHLFCFAQNTPLPYLNISAQNLKTQPLSAETVKIIAALTKDAPKKSAEIPPLYIFPSDTEANADYQLFLIVQNYLKTKKWSQSISELQKFLLVRRTPEITYRAEFYLAQALFFDKKYTESLYKFLEVTDYFPNQTQLWIQAALRALSPL